MSRPVMGALLAATTLLTVLAMMIVFALPAAAQSPADLRAREARRVERQADALTRANPRMNPASARFYDNSPWTTDWVLQMCRGPAPRPRASTCRAAGAAR